MKWRTVCGNLFSSTNLGPRIWTQAVSLVGKVLLPNEPTSGPLCDALTQGILLLCRSMF